MSNMRLLNTFKENTQRYKVLKHLIYLGKITNVDAFQLYNITRLSAVIFDLRAAGADIETNMVTKNHHTYAEYKLS